MAHGVCDGGTRFLSAQRKYGIGFLLLPEGPAILQKTPEKGGCGKNDACELARALIGRIGVIDDHSYQMRCVPSGLRLSIRSMLHGS